MADDPVVEVRLDKWLWAARFFKTRSVAQQAIRGGKVVINGQRAKPARGVRAGDRLVITKGHFQFEVRVEAVSERRGPASQAMELYAETEESIRQRAELSEQRRLERAASGGPERKPDKRQRRQIRKFRRG